LPTDIQIDNTTLEDHQQQAFIDASPFLETARAYIPPKAAVTENGMDISHFFERPILIQSYEWDDGNTFAEQIAPWYKYFSHPSIAPKLLGFARLTADLEVEIRINGSPFRFSQILASYRPLFSLYKSRGSSGTTPCSLADYSGGYLPEDGCSVAGNNLKAFSGGTNFTLLARSQRQCTYLDVATSTGGKFVLPFVHPFNALRVNNMVGIDAVNQLTLFGIELTSMGTLTMESLSTLRNMQTATAAGVTIDVFVRAINARAWLASGVATAVPQGQERKPSQVASTVASVASIFKHVPVIGTYATLVETIAGAGSRLLQFFGYTPRPDVSLPQYVTGYSYPVESSVTFPKKVRNLGLDHENNVVVDPGVIDGQSEDSLAFASFCARPALLCRTYFSSSLVVDDPIMILPVSPFHASTELVTNAELPNARRIQLTPCALAAMNFRYWRGTMCVRLQSIQTAFHRGRLRITWEPELGNETSNAQCDLVAKYEGYQQILNWDLSATPSVTMKVGFGARKGRLTIPRLGTPGLVDNSFITNTEANPTTVSSSSITVDNYEDYFNGFLRVSVLTRLQAPDASYPVPIMVHVWYEDMEFYDPLENGPSLATLESIDSVITNFPTDSSTYYGTVFRGEDMENLMTRNLCPDLYYPQGEEPVEEIAPPIKVITMEAQGEDVFEFQPTTVVEESVYEGEKVGSLRSLLQRDVFYDTISFEIPRTTSQADISTSLINTIIDTPPTICMRMLPQYPHPFGTTAPSRSATQTLNVVNPAFKFTGTGGNERTFYPNMARTNLFPLIRECFLGFRGSYNWKFVPIVESGCRIKCMTASRANFTHSAHPKIGSFPRNKRISPYSLTPDYVGNDGPGFSSADSSAIIPIIYDTGTTRSPPGLGLRDVYSGTVNKLSSIRRFLNAYLGSFASGSLVVNSDEQKTLGIRIPYFSNVRFMPGSTTGWMNANSNAELAQNVRFTIVTEGTDQARFDGFLYAASNATATANANMAVLHGPTRAFVSVAAICSAGDDISFGGFISVPTLYLTSATVFTDSSNANT